MAIVASESQHRPVSEKWRKIWTKKTLMGLVLGQFVSLLITSTGFTSSELARRGVNAPTSQSFLNYLLLAIFYGALFIHRKRPLQIKWYYYLMLAVVDVEGNYIVVKAYQYTSLTSVMLLDCWTIPCVILLTWLFLKTKYGFRQFAGVAMCVAGLIMVVFSDVHATDRAAGGPNPLKGDMLVFAGSTLYAVSNVGEEYSVTKADRVELMAMLGAFGAVISAIQISIVERNELKGIDWTAGMVLPFIGFALAMFLFYSTVPVILKICGATLLNLSLLTSDMWAVLIRIFAYHEKQFGRRISLPCQSPKVLVLFTCSPFSCSTCRSPPMKRKKWREEEEATLIREYAALLSPPAPAPGGALLLARLRTREKKFQPIADRVNSAHHFRDPVAFPFRWSWRDISVKIHNMRHQFLHVKRKLLPLPAHLHPDHALHLWPNFLLYKQVFGDHVDPNHRTSFEIPASDENHDDDDSHNDEEDEDDGMDEEDGMLLSDFSSPDQELAKKDKRIVALIADRDEEVEELGIGSQRRHSCRRRRKKIDSLIAEMVELGEIAMTREERRYQREALREDEDHEREQQKRALAHQREMEEEEERREQWRRRRRSEERREEEDMQWRERILVMQMEHEKQSMKMQADAFQAQMQMIAILVRIVCQFPGGAGGGDSGIGGMQHHVMQPPQQQHQESPESLVGDSGKNGDHSGRHYV
ncbi:solute carrier family 35 member F1-like isoform X1 [Canna indica]|uniref:Solute carrier family 35 member F1-like isoform X1 n=1 Tax=Canna indica TaxID=4628 RepID=A0AAQ3K846_9LILI|nr:solute carrier family 35 member F1-like isoform X1 [Canna indica]